MGVGAQTRPSRFATALGAAFLALGTVSVASETVSEDDRRTFRETIDVRWVELDVAVSDHEGRPVQGLGPGDFRLLHGDQEVEIRHFVEIREGVETATKAPPRPRTIDDRLWLVVYLDRTWVEPGQMPDVVPAVRAFLREEMRPGDRLLLAEAAPELSILQEFTAIPERIGAAIDDPARVLPSRASREASALYGEIGRVAERTRAQPGLSRDEMPRALRIRIESLAEMLQGEIARAAHQLHRLLPAMSGLPGRKVLVYVGGTPPTDAPESLRQAWMRTFGPGSVHAETRQVPEGLRHDLVWTTLETDAADFGTFFEEVARRANASDVRLHVLDVGALRTSPVAERNEAISEGFRGRTLPGGRRIGSSEVLRVLAEDTGGRVLSRHRDFPAALTTIGSDLANRYLLGFETSGPDNSLERVRVELRDTGERRRLVARREVRLRSADRRAAERAVAALLLGATDDPLGVRLDVAAPSIQEETGAWQAPVTVRIPAARLGTVDDGTGSAARLTLFFTSGNLSVGAATVQGAIVPLRLDPADRDPDVARDVEYRVELPLRAGSSRVAVVVRDDVGDLVSAVVADVPTAGATGH